MQEESCIMAIGTSNGEFEFSQEEVLHYMQKEYGDINAGRKLAILSRQSGIVKRHSVIPDFSLRCLEPQLFNGGQPPNITERMFLYKKKALPLAIDAVENAFGKILHLNLRKNITHIITVSCTGLYAPGLSIDLIHELKLPDNTFHTSINFMGCNASFAALRMGDLIIKADKNAVVLIVAVELCTIHFQPKDDNDNLLANTIFADGAAAVILTSTEQIKQDRFIIKKFLTLTLAEGKNLMEWNINSTNYEMVLSADIPQFLASRLDYITSRLYENFSLHDKTPVKWAIHPGGKRILDEIRKKLELGVDSVVESYDVLNQFGNMSSVTILFVLKQILENTRSVGDLISIGFGPGISIESAHLMLERAN